MKKNWILALVSLLVLTLWMVSGCFSGDASGDYGVRRVEKPLFKVQVREMEAVLIEKELLLSGKTIPARSVVVRSENDARVVELGVERGAMVTEGEVIAVLDERDLKEKLDEAMALLDQRELEYRAADDLLKKKFQSETKVAEARAALDGARARVKEVQVDLANTRIVAPFSGVLEDRMVELGDYLKKGDDIAKVIEVDPIVFEARLNERQIGSVRNGMSAFAKTLEGKFYEGFIRYASMEGDANVRTFDVELEVENPDLRIPAGVSAEVIIPVEKVEGYGVSPGVLSLGEDGDLGVKIVDDEDIVRFIPAEIARSSTTEVWLTGLPEKIRLIVLGQGFVSAGDKVMVSYEKEDSGE